MCNFKNARSIAAGVSSPALLAAIAVCGPWASSSAADTGETTKLEEIIVTAQRREQNLQDVGTSVTAFDANSVERLGLKDATDIVGQVPGMQFNQYGATVTVYNLRGVSQNDFSDHQEAPIAVYSDDAYIANTGALAGSLFDLQRVEVLRGPQGTLFGRNATGGLIQYVSKQPTDAPEGYVQVTAGNYHLLQTEGAVGGPLSDRVDARASFQTSYHDGYITNRIGYSINNQKQFAGRVQFKIKPSDDGEILIKLDAVNNDHETEGNYSWATAIPDSTGRGVFAPPGTPDFGGYVNTSTSPFNQAENRRGLFNRTVWDANVRVNWQFSGFSFASVTDFMQLQKRYGEDSDISPNPIFNYDTGVHYQQFSQEFRFNGTVGALRWITGAYYIKYKTNNFEQTVLPNYIPPVPFPYGDGLAQLGLTTSSPAVFGQLEYDLSEHWTAIAGARYTSDEKSYVFNYACNVCGPPNPTSPPGGFPYAVTYSTAAGYPQAEHTYHIPTGKVEIDYKIDHDNLLYASVNRGAKGGGWSAPSSGYVNLNPAYTFLPVLNLNYNEERLTSYELGFKSTFWDGKARVNGDLFYYDYKDYQGFFLDVATTIVENVNAKVKGGELEVAVAPLRGLNVQLGVSYLDTRAEDVPTPAGALITARLPQAPLWSLNAEARYEWAALGGQLSVESDAKWNKQQYMERSTMQRMILEHSYIVTNARVCVVPAAAAAGSSRLTAKTSPIAGIGLYNLDLSGFLGIDQSVFAPPRTFGASVLYRWGK